MNNEDLTKRIEVLETFMNNLQSSQSIPLSVHQAFLDNLVGNTLTTTGEGTATTQTINLTGNAQNITVPAQPSKTLKINVAETTYEVYVK